MTRSSPRDRERFDERDPQGHRRAGGPGPGRRPHRGRKHRTAARQVLAALLRAALLLRGRRLASAWCTPSPSTGRWNPARRRRLHPGLGVRFTVPMRDAVLRPAHPPRRRGLGPAPVKPSRASPACAVTRARRSRRPSIAGTEAARPVHLGPARHEPSAVHPASGATTPWPSSTPTASRCASAPRRAMAGSTRPAARAPRLRLRRRRERRLRLRPAGTSGSGTPTQLDIRDAPPTRPRSRSGSGRPRRRAMDLRFYHDGMGQDTYAEQLEGLEITYEDYEPGFGTPYGIARTTELMLLGAASRRRRRSSWPNMVAAVRAPPLLAAPAQAARQAKVFGLGSLRRARPLAPRSRPVIEDQLDFLFDLLPGPGRAAALVRLLGLRRRHAHLRRRPARWRYDVGGFAWDNSELSPDLWLWYGVPPHGPGRYVPLRRGDDPAHRRGRRLPSWPVGGARHPAQRAALGRQRQAAAHQQRRSTAGSTTT